MPSKLKPLWRCPKCGEKFITKNMWHSCGKRSLKALFSGSEPHYKSVYRNQGWISPAVLQNGRVIGIWSNKRKENRSSLTIELFEKLSKTLRAMIEEEVAGLGDFLETSFEIRFGKKNHGG